MSQATSLVKRSILFQALLLALLFTPLTALGVDIKLEPTAKDGLIRGEGPAKITVMIEGEPGVYELHQQFTDRYGETTTGETLKVQLKDKVSRTVDVPVKYYGPAWYSVELRKSGSDDVVATAKRVVIRPVPVPTLTMEERADSPIGTNVHTAAHWDTLGAMGIHWARDYSWSWLGHGEKAPMAGNGTNFTTTFQDADKAGITILPCMQQTLRTPDKMYFIDDTDTMAAMYERLSNQWPMAPYWELDNEADLMHRDRSSPQFAKWTETYKVLIPNADRGLKRAGHDAKLVLNGEAGIHPEYTQMLIDAVGDHFDVVNYHYYTGTIPPELAILDSNTGSEDRPVSTSFVDQMRTINQIAHAAGKEAWLTEVGWSADHGPAVGDRLQGAYFQRVYLLGEIVGTDKTYWFWDRDLPGEGRFADTGLMDLDTNTANPVGAAVAMLSKHTAQADFLGTVDLGEDRWCVVFESKDGGKVVIAWAVESEHDLPSELASVEEAYDMYGNPLRDRKLTAEPTFFVMDELPAAWTGQLGVERHTPRIVNVYAGSDQSVAFAAPGAGAIKWEGLPDHATGGDWAIDDASATAALGATPQLQPGTYQLAAVVSGGAGDAAWTKRFPLTMRVHPAVDVASEPYSPSESTDVKLTNQFDRPLTVSLKPEHGAVEPAEVKLAPGESKSVAFTAPADEYDPITLTLSLDNGGSQSGPIRPRVLEVPRASNVTIDGDLSDWPEGGVLPPASLKLTGPYSDFAPTMRLAWNDKGLLVATTIPVGPGFISPAEPQSFWEWTSFEMNMSATDMNTEPGQVRAHQFWFVPQKHGDTWTVFGGEWMKLMPDGTKKTLNGDDRAERKMTYDGQNVVIEVQIFNDMLDKAPSPGQSWPYTVDSKFAAPHIPRTVARWPGGSAQGWDGWGRITFVE